MGTGFGGIFTMKIMEGERIKGHTCVLPFMSFMMKSECH
jgi:hypothetical protein